ncbi:dephospho-CoA kinase [Cryomorphaceae bacterium 1068]|nr:dephospho-CoA kinase [Cryomorphaceae bacterium 1068]
MPKSKPLRVGITGGIGAGKSVVAKVFSVLGVPVFNADAIAKQILTSDPEVVSAVRGHFGAGAYRDGVPDRDYLARVVFSDSSQRETLNSIIHPAVGTAFEEFCAANEQLPYVLKEAAILVETGGYEQLDALILVTAPEALRIDRALSRDKTDRASVEKRISAQLSDEEKRPHAHFEIENDDKNPVIPKVLQIHNAILRSA